MPLRTRALAALAALAQQGSAVGRLRGVRREVRRIPVGRDARQLPTSTVAAVLPWFAQGCERGPG